MADGTKIEWADASWNPIRGCTRISEGCRNCYAEDMAARFSAPGQWGAGLATTVRRPDGTLEPRWAGTVTRAKLETWTQPLRWRKPRRVFVCSTSDLFQAAVPDAWIDEAFAVMALCPQHQFLVLTKRPERMRQYVCENEGRTGWPLPNVWLGVSVEDQATADARIPHLLATPAAVRFISAEPLLGPVDLTRVPVDGGYVCALRGARPAYPSLNWVIAGGESGARARPMHPAWARSLRDQCEAAEVPFFFKQWGEWMPTDTWLIHAGCTPVRAIDREGREVPDDANPDDVGGQRFVAVGKGKAGRLLDGRRHDDAPEPLELEPAHD